MYFPIFVLYFLFQISPNVQTRLTIVTITQYVPISLLHLIVVAILVIWGMEHIAKVSLYDRKL